MLYDTSEHICGLQKRKKNTNIVLWRPGRDVDRQWLINVEQWNRLKHSKKFIFHRRNGWNTNNQKLQPWTDATPRAEYFIVIIVFKSLDMALYKYSSKKTTSSRVKCTSERKTKSRTPENGNSRDVKRR